jgi:hypothetical protein
MPGSSAARSVRLTTPEEDAMELIVKNVSQPDDHQVTPSGRLDAAVINLDTLFVAVGTLQPGWRWSEDVQPYVGGDSCQFTHTGYLLEGTMHVEMDDGTSLDVHAGDAYLIPPGHDGWVVGDVPVRAVDFGNRVEEYATKP